mgnify:CR=1 FL=1
MGEKINRVTVLLAVYCGDNISYFNESISSLINQKKYIYEILIIINGPIEEELILLINEFKNILPIRIVKYQNNLGISRALNLTLPLIESEWIARLDSDDICDKNRFKNMNRIINTYGDEFDVFGTYIKEFSQKINDKNIIRKVPLNINLIKFFSIFSSPLNNVTTFYKKKLTIKDDNFYPVFDGFEDYGLWLKLIYKKIKIKNIPIISVNVRIGNNMLGRRGGFTYIKNELKFRLHCAKYIDKLFLFPYLMASIFRILTFMLPNSLKKYLYLLKRKFF